MEAGLAIRRRKEKKENRHKNRFPLPQPPMEQKEGKKLSEHAHTNQKKKNGGARNGKGEVAGGQKGMCYHRRYKKGRL